MERLLLSERKKWKGEEAPIQWASASNWKWHIHSSCVCDERCYVSGVPSLLQENGRNGGRKEKSPHVSGNKRYPDEDQLLACPLDVAMHPWIKIEITNQQQLEWLSSGRSSPNPSNAIKCRHLFYFFFFFNIFFILYLFGYMACRDSLRAMIVCYVIYI